MIRRLLLIPFVAMVVGMCGIIAISEAVDYRAKPKPKPKPRGQCVIERTANAMLRVFS